MEKCPQLLDLIPKDREWALKNRGGVNGEKGHESSEKKLELRLGLGPPGDENAWMNKINKREDHPLFDFGYFPNTISASRGFSDTAAEHQQNLSQTHKFSSPKPPFLHPQRLPVIAKEPSQPCHPSLGDLQVTQKNKGLPPSAVPANTAGSNNSSQKRAAPPPVVGWPPIRSFRKNLASSSSSKPTSESDHQNVQPNKMVSSDKPEETSRKGMFVKIHMEGVPIGRKVDLKACGSYEHLSSAVDELFRGLLAAQRDPGTGNQNKQERENAIITGLLDGSGEYTLVYEDNEGDRMLVGDVPWHMFVSTARRLRVLKSSEASGLSVGCSKQERIRPLSRMK